MEFITLDWLNSNYVNSKLVHFHLNSKQFEFSLLTLNSSTFESASNYSHWKTQFAVWKKTFGDLVTRSTSKLVWDWDHILTQTIDRVWTRKIFGMQASWFTLVAYLPDVGWCQSQVRVALLVGAGGLKPWPDPSAWYTRSGHYLNYILLAFKNQGTL